LTPRPHEGLIIEWQSWAESDLDPAPDRPHRRRHLNNGGRAVRLRAQHDPLITSGDDE
jgi:hypothetical protein